MTFAPLILTKPRTDQMSEVVREIEPLKTHLPENYKILG